MTIFAAKGNNSTTSLGIGVVNHSRITLMPKPESWWQLQVRRDVGVLDL